MLVADDTDSDAKRKLAGELGVELVTAPDDDTVARLVDASTTVVPAPGVPEDHRVVQVALARGRRVVTELELAYEWEQQRPGGPRPILAVTGTDGKTTTTLLTVAMLAAAACRSVAAGNTEVPLVEAIDRDLDALVVECTSFRLAFTTRVPRRRRGVAQPCARSPQLAPLARLVRRREGQHLRQSAGDGRGDRERCRRAW